MRVVRSMEEGRSGLAPREEHHIRTLCGGAGYEHECFTIRKVVRCRSKE